MWMLIGSVIFLFLMEESLRIMEAAAIMVEDQAVL